METKVQCLVIFGTPGRHEDVAAANAASGTYASFVNLVASGNLEGVGPLKSNFVRLSQLAVLLLLAAIVGDTVGQLRNPKASVRASEKFSGITNCVTVVPKSWGEFKGGSEYGLAFQDDNGVVRFVMHPTCGAINSPLETPPAPIDLEIERR